MVEVYKAVDVYENIDRKETMSFTEIRFMEAEAKMGKSHAYIESGAI